MPDEDQLFFVARRSASVKPAPARISTGYGAKSSFLKVQLALLPTRKEIWRATLMGILAGSTLTIVLALAFWH